MQCGVRVESRKAVMRYVVIQQREKSDLSVDLFWRVLNKNEFRSVQ